MDSLVYGGRKRKEDGLLGDSTESGLAVLRGSDKDGVVIAVGAVVAEEPSGAVLVDEAKRNCARKADSTSVNGRDSRRCKERRIEQMS